MQSNNSQSNSRQPQQRSNFMSLPNEIHSQILQQLGASSTVIPSEAHRDMFAFAQTNSHFLNLSGTMINSIKPNLDNYISQYSSPSHLLSIARIAGGNLREIHIPRGGFHILLNLLQYCPNVENLHLVQDTSDSLSVQSGVFNFNFRKLSIHNPQPDFLWMVISPPIELTLTAITEESLEEIPRILQDPTKALTLHFEFRKLDPPGFSETMECILTACPKVERLHLTVKPSRGYRNIHFYEEAQQLINGARRNPENSLCRSITLEGSSTFRVLTKAHPRAKINLTSHDITFSDEGDGMYATGLVLEDEFLNLNVSRLRKVRIGKNCSPLWAQTLDGVQLDYAFIDCVGTNAAMGLSVDLVRLSPRAVASTHSLTEWNWLSKVRRLRIPAPTPIFENSADPTWFFYRVRRILGAFHGDVILLSSPHSYFSIKRILESTAPLTIASTFEGIKLLEAIENHEKRGCDLESLKAFVHDWKRSKKEIWEEMKKKLSGEARDFWEGVYLTYILSGG